MFSFYLSNNNIRNIDVKFLDKFPKLLHCSFAQNNITKYIPFTNRNTWTHIDWMGNAIENISADVLISSYSHSFYKAGVKRGQYSSNRPRCPHGKMYIGKMEFANNSINYLSDLFNGFGYNEMEIECWMKHIIC